MKYPMITAAVVAAIGAASSAHALDVAATLAAPVQLVAAGASAARDNFLAEMNNSICKPGTLTVYRANPTGLQDFRAYSCTITNGGATATAFGAAAGGDATIYYRAEGGSAWGPASIATGRTISSLVVDTRCTNSGSTIAAGSGTAPLFNCAVSGYALSNDNAVAGLTKRATELGISDEEPNMYVDLNYPGFASSAFPSFNQNVQSQLNSLNRTVGFAQVFGVLVSNSGGSATVSSLTYAEMAGIYSGSITDWNDTINPATGNPNPDGPITVVRRENGSGTQVAAAHEFLNTSNCTPGGAGTFRVDTDPVATGACSATNPTGIPADTDGVIERGATGDLEACIGFGSGAIGPNVFKAGTNVPSGTHYVALSGVFPNKYSAAKGDYKYVYELTLQDGTGRSAADNAAAAGLKTVMQKLASTPNSDSVIALPNVFNSAIIPVPTTGVPVALFSKGGNSCANAVVGPK